VAGATLLNSTKVVANGCVASLPALFVVLLLAFVASAAAVRSSRGLIHVEPHPGAD
jgi:hypothetical protein